MTTSMALRGESILMAELPDLFTTVFPNEGTLSPIGDKYIRTYGMYCISTQIK
jgi:hypothetical protein